MLRRLGFLLACMALALQGMAMEVVVSHTVFYNPQKKLDPYLELYWQIDPKSLHFAESDRWRTKIETRIVIKKGETLIKEDAFVLQTPPADVREAALYQGIIDLQRYDVPPGNITVSISFTEAGYPENKFDYNSNITIDPPSEDPMYSGLQLLDTAYASNGGQSIFNRNENVQVPLSMNFLPDSKTSLYFYTELYGSDKVDTVQHPLRLVSFISKRPLEGAVVKLQRTDTIKPAVAIPFTGHFNIQSLPSGNFYLNVILYDRNNVKLTTRTLFFQRSNANPVPLQVDTTTAKQDGNVMEKVNIFNLDNAFVSKYNLGQLKAILKMVIPIATAVEMENINNFLRKPEESFMRYFIYNFWKSRNDKDPEKAWLDYAEQVKEVNKQFKVGTKPGYETDRGMVYLKYGQPVEMINVQNEQGAYPYEIWQYNSTAKQSRPGIFLFYRPANMINDYQLLHSTVPGEIRNTSWRSMLYINGESGSTNSRAEQYLPNSR